MRLDTIFFDLDSTLYPESCGLWGAIRERIDLYMLEQMKLPPDIIPQLRQEYLSNHGTTLRGLQANYQIDPKHYLSFVHDLRLEQYLRADPELRDLLFSIPHRRWVFTNSDAPHALRVMEILGIGDCFEGTIDVWAMDPHCKPLEPAYRFALEFVGDPPPQNCAILDDAPRNLSPAKALGMFTVLVGHNGCHPAADRSLVDIHDLPAAVPEFWEY